MVTVRIGPDLDESRLDQLAFSSELADAIVRHCAAALPHEGCGLLAGHLTAGSLRADRFFPGTNVQASATRFVMDPAEVVAALDAIQRDGARLAAIVHSHPASEAVPSATDLREAHYPDALLLIVSFAVDPPALRAWRVVRAGAAPTAREVPVRRIGPRGP